MTRPRPETIFSAVVIVLAVLVFGSIGVNKSCGSTHGNRRRDNQPAERSNENREETATRQISGRDWMGCTDREYFDKLITLAGQKDQEALSRALAAGLLSGECVELREGEEVYVMDSTIFSGLAKVRRVGEVREYWTNLEAIR
jgi:hypothetical protein